MKKILYCLAVILFNYWGILAQSTIKPLNNAAITTGAERIEVYLPYLKGKAVAVFANQTSTVKNTHLVDTLLKRGVNIVKIFGPEHGFRGTADAGEHVTDVKDKATGIPVISLYGDHKKPTPEDFKGVDILIFDIQDVGVRFYTYISSLQYYLEAALENHKPLLILDRPNPNGDFVDGPVLEPAFKSFVGMNRIPILHGLTLGEYALMLNGEKWLKKGIHCRLKVVKNENYPAYLFKYNLPASPSPNLPNLESVYLYPSICLFEGTRISVGRGTSLPFQWIGYPGFKGGNQSMTPRSIIGVISHPPYEDTVCNGLNLQKESRKYQKGFPPHQIRLDWLIEMYNSYPDKDHFFTSFF